MRNLFTIFSCILFIIGFGQDSNYLSKAEEKIKEGAKYYREDFALFGEKLHEADSLLNFASGSQTESEKFNLLKGKVKNNLGVFYWQNDQLQQSLVCFDSSLYFREKVNEIEGMVHSLALIAMVYEDMGKIYEAEHSFRKALEYLDQNPDTLLVIDVYNNLGVLFCRQNMNPEGHKYFVKALNLMGDDISSAKATVLNNIGSTLIEMDSLEASIDFFRKAFPMFEELDDRNGLASTLLNFGRVSGKRKEYEDAITYYDEALIYFKDTKDEFGMIETYNELSTVYLALGEKKKALDYALQAEALLSEYDKLITRKGVYESLFHAFKANGNSTEALKYFELFSEYADSIQNEDFVRDAMYNESQTRFLKERDSLNQAYDKERILQEGKTKQERQIFLFTIIVISIILIFLIVVVRGYRARQKLIKENFIQEQLLNKQLESSLIEKSKQLSKESLKNLKSQKVFDEIESIIKESNETNSDQMNQNIRSIKSEINEGKLTQKKIDTHAVFLEKENEDFSLLLKKQHPKLTPRDLKLCVLLRNNYSSDEICMMLSISHHTFHSSKYRIRRRMELEKGTRLQDYLLQI